jgi:hypothetical protein
MCEGLFEGLLCGGSAFQRIKSNTGRRHAANVESLPRWRGCFLGSGF